MLALVKAFVVVFVLVLAAIVAPTTNAMTIANQTHPEASQAH